MKFLLSVLFLILGTAVLCAQEEDFAHPELEWRTIETAHFLVHFHTGTEWTASKVAEIAEEIYKPITDLYEHEPDQKVSFVIRDHDDYSNGAAYFYDNKIEIWASSMDFEFRGIHPWLHNVVTHEFTHLIQIQTAMKYGRRIPAFYFQWFGYEAARRPDVLYGFPNILVSYPISGFVVPSWFAEGTAQYNHPDLEFDFWDSHRDMILRSYMLDGNPLTWEEMSVFGKSSLGNESSYNAGFSIVQYIAERYGVEKLRLISSSLGSFGRLTIDGAIESVLGKSGEELYNEWKEHETGRYREQVSVVRARPSRETIVESEGFGNFYPEFSPDGKQLAYVSNKEKDYLSQSSIYLLNLSTRAKEKIGVSVRSALAFSVDGKNIYYSRLTDDNPHWSRYADIFCYSLEEREESRVTHGLRAMNPELSPDGSSIAFTFSSDGTSNIGLVRTNGSGFRSLTSFRNGEQVYRPTWSPDGKKLAFGFSRGHAQSIAIIDTSGSGFSTLIAAGDSRDPAFSRDGRYLYYSCDTTGIFNIYERDLESGSTRMVTNVLGGAFLPAVNNDGSLAFASYTSGGYKLALMRADSVTSEWDKPDSAIASARIGLSAHIVPSSPRPFETSHPFDGNAAAPDSQRTIAMDSRPYRNTFSSLSILPLVRIDNYNPQNKGIDIVKPGLYVTTSDMLNRMSLIASGAINRKLERDLFFIFDFRGKIPGLFSLGLEPTLSLEFYNSTRKTRTSFELPPFPGLVTTEVTYDLLEFDVAFRHKVINENGDLRTWYALSRYTANIGTFVNPNTSFVNPAFRNEYLIGHLIGATFQYNGIEREIESVINPVGRRLSLTATFEFDKFNPDGEFEIVDGVLVPVYERFQFPSVEARWDEFIPLPIKHHTLGVGLRGASVIGETVPSFFDFYAGGLIGMRGYPFYSLGGNSIAMLNVSYRFPLWRSMNLRFLQFYFTKLYASVYGDIGNSWTGQMPSFQSWKKDAGFEFRLESFSYYAYPTRIFIGTAYGFDRINLYIPPVTVNYGQEWLFYLTVLFSFELNDAAFVRWR